MQRVAVSRWFGFSQVGFDRDLRTNMSETIMESSWDDATPPIYPGGSQQYRIVANWATGHSGAATASVVLPNPGYALPAGGCAAFGSEGDLVGGWFTRFNNRTLPPGPAAAPYHAIIEDRECTQPGMPARGDGQPAAVCLYHPMGVDTALDIRAPAKCLASQTTVTAVNRAGGAIARVPATASPGSRWGGIVTFTAAAVVGASATPVDHFVLRC